MVRKDRMDATSYTFILQSNLLQYVAKMLGGEGKSFILQQDNAPHIALTSLKIS